MASRQVSIPMISTATFGALWRLPYSFQMALSTASAGRFWLVLPEAPLSLFCLPDAARRYWHSELCCCSLVVQLSRCHLLSSNGSLTRRWAKTMTRKTEEVAASYSTACWEDFEGAVLSFRSSQLWKRASEAANYGDAKRSKKTNMMLSMSPFVNTILKEYLSQYSCS